MSRRRRPSVASLRAVNVAPRVCAKTLAREVDRLAALRAGAPPQHEGDTIEHRASVVAAWIEAMREASRCKRCGDPLEDPVSVARGIGPHCWEKKLTDDERAAVTAWVERQQHGDQEPM